MKLFTVVFPVAEVQNTYHILLGKQKPGLPFAGYFNGYGGKVEEGESIEHAAERELFEELGVRVEDIKSIGSIIHDQKKVYFFLSKLEYRDYLPQEAMVENTWFLLDDASFVQQMLPGDEAIIMHVRENIENYFEGKEMTEFDIEKTGREIDEATKELDRRLGPSLK